MNDREIKKIQTFIKDYYWETHLMWQQYSDLKVGKQAKGNQDVEKSTSVNVEELGMKSKEVGEQHA